MKSALKFIVLLFCCVFANYCFAQGEFSDSRETSNYNINQYGIKISSNGFGVRYNFAQRVNYRLRRIYDVEFDYIKSLKEVKMENSLFSSYSNKVRKFVFGKDNSVHNLRLGYGYNRMIFEKRDKNSVSVHLQANIGFTLAFEKPVYYVMVDSVSQVGDMAYYYLDTCRFDDYYTGKTMDIVTRAPFTAGLRELRVRPGNYIKLNVSFDFAQDAMLVSALEVGTIIDFYYLPVTIMHNQPKRFIWSLYVAYVFGRKYNPALNRDYRREMRKK